MELSQILVIIILVVVFVVIIRGNVLSINSIIAVKY